MPSDSDVGSAVSSIIGSYLGGQQGAGVLPPDIAALLKQLQNIAGTSNIGAQVEPTGENKQTAIDDIIVQIAGQLFAPQTGGDPSRGKVPGFSQQNDITLIPDSVQEALNAARTKARAHQMNLETAHSHDPYRNDPLHYAPIDPTIWQGGDPSKEVNRTKDPDGTIHIYYEDGHERTVLPPDPAMEFWASVLTLCAGAGAGILVGSKSLVGGVFAGLAAAAGMWYLTHRNSNFPSDDGGSGGPRSSLYVPDPETGSGGGPRALGEMPDPETGTGGGPRHFYFPDPDSGGGSGPRS
jgi:hypothetical protein